MAARKLKLSEAIRGALGEDDETALAWIAAAKKLESEVEHLTREIDYLVNGDRDD